MPQKEEGGQKRGRFRDNDGLAALLAVQLNADLLMLCTDVDGLYTGNPSDPASDFIPTYCPEARTELFCVHTDCLRADCGCTCGG